MNSAFQTVFDLLMGLSRLTGLTYEEINVVIYYFVVPFVFLLLLDRILRMWLFSISFVVLAGIFLFTVPDFTQFAKQLFGASVLFLLQFSRFGVNYVEASVWICVVLPALMFVVLAVIAFIRSLSGNVPEKGTQGARRAVT